MKIEVFKAKKELLLKCDSGWVLVTHICNCSYSGGRYQEDHGSTPTKANSSEDPILKIPNIKQGW
jgi:hypothetical protein